MRRWLLLGLALFAGTASAGTIQGRVVDSTGSALPGVTVEGCGVVAVTGGDGSYVINSDAPACDVSFRLLNFATVVRRGVTPPAKVDATLYLSAAADVVVTAKQTFRNLADMNEPVNDLLGVADAASVGVVTAQEIERRPFARAGEVLETVPGVVVSQHSGEGKANQYYLRGFNLDHGTDISITVAGVPVNMPTHAHGQGYADANFLIPELIGAVQYRKGPYFAEEGDFASAGAVNVGYLNVLEHPLAMMQGGTYGYGRALFADSPRIGNGYLLYAVEAGRNDGPWTRPDDFRKFNGVLRYTTGDQRGAFSITAMGYGSKWSSTDQIPERAVSEGLVSRFGSLDTGDGGETHRYSLSADWQRSGASSLTQVSAYAVDYQLDLFSNFTYFLDDPVNGDQFEQFDRRRVYGAKASHRWLSRFWGVTAENVVGADVRDDDIGDVGLYHTHERQRLGTVRQDDVMETSGSLYVQSTLQWSEHLRTIVGLRGDSYRFRVSGVTRDASMASPKLSVILGPWRNTELYLNAGSGFHSNDGRGVIAATDPATALVRTEGAEIGLRTKPLQRLHLTAALWGLDIGSELVFTGDAGTTESSRASRRAGIELAAFYNVTSAVTIDGDYAFSRARFRDAAPEGEHIPGAVEGVASAGLSLTDFHRFGGELRYRYFGPRPLIENNSVRSKAASTISARLSYSVTPRVRFAVDAFNILDAKVSDVDYFYTSRLRGEPAGGVDDIHFHPLEKRSVRFAVTTTF